MLSLNTTYRHSHYTYFILSKVAVYYSSPSIVAPFSGVALAWVVLLAPCIGERPEPIRVCGAVLILWGILVVSAFGDHVTNEQKTLDEVVRFVVQSNQNKSIQQNNEANNRTTKLKSDPRCMLERCD